MPTAPSATVKADAGPADPIVNLLYTTPAVVAVSSKVDNPKDFPEHLIDGKPETAWNGKTGDLVGGWIAFRVPADAHVNVISMSAGFDKRSKAGDDLFSQNHRIARVRVSRNGAALKEVSFNLGKRTPQDIKVDVAGGDFKIEVLEVAPGTKAEWRELTVSELAVWGTRGATRLEGTHLPSVRVGSLDPVDAGADAAAPLGTKPMRGPLASLAAFCASYDGEWKPRFAAEKDDYPGFIEGPYCTVSDEALLSDKPPARILDVRTVGLTTHDARHQHVAIKTRRGWFITAVIVSTEELRNPGCAGGCTDEAPEFRFSAATSRMPGNEDLVPRGDVDNPHLVAARGGAGVARFVVDVRPWSRRVKHEQRRPRHVGGERDRLRDRQRRRVEHEERARAPVRCAHPTRDDDAATVGGEADATRSAQATHVEPRDLSARNVDDERAR